MNIRKARLFGNFFFGVACSAGGICARDNRFGCVFFRGGGAARRMVTILIDLACFALPCIVLG